MNLTKAELRLEFVNGDVIKDHYYRNNRTSGQKNLRCFPCCGDHHSESTFCGTKLSTKLRYKWTPLITADDLVIVGEFKPLVDDMCDSEVINLSKIGGIYENDLKSKLKTRSESLHQFYGSKESCRTERQGDYFEITSDFNEECFSWHYGWRGNRYKQSTKHSFVVSILLREDNKSISPNGNFLRLIGQFSSPSFCVLSLRRRVIPPSSSNAPTPIDLQNNNIISKIINQNEDNYENRKKSRSPFIVFHDDIINLKHPRILPAQQPSSSSSSLHIHQRVIPYEDREIAVNHRYLQQQQQQQYQNQNHNQIQTDERNDPETSLQHIPNDTTSAKLIDDEFGRYLSGSSLLHSFATIASQQDSTPFEV